VPMILVGNKSDLVDERAVPREVGKAMANHFGVPYIETSAKRGINVEETFEKVMRLILLDEQKNGGGGGQYQNYSNSRMSEQRLNNSLSAAKSIRKGKGGKKAGGPCVIC
jgi:GTPase SAR1 family protein